MHICLMWWCGGLDLVVKTICESLLCTCLKMAHSLKTAGSRTRRSDTWLYSCVGIKMTSTSCYRPEAVVWTRKFLFLVLRVNLGQGMYLSVKIDFEKHLCKLFSSHAYC